MEKKGKHISRYKKDFNKFLDDAPKDKEGNILLEYYKQDTELYKISPEERETIIHMKSFDQKEEIKEAVLEFRKDLFLSKNGTLFTLTEEEEVRVYKKPKDSTGRVTYSIVFRHNGKTESFRDYQLICLFFSEHTTFAKKEIEKHKLNGFKSLIVHHINGNKQDNRPENLQAIPKTFHNSFIHGKILTPEDPGIERLLELGKKTPDYLENPFYIIQEETRDGKRPTGRYKEIDIDINELLKKINDKMEIQISEEYFYRRLEEIAKENGCKDKEEYLRNWVTVHKVDNPEYTQEQAIETIKAIIYYLDGIAPIK